MLIHRISFSKAASLDLTLPTPEAVPALDYVGRSLGNLCRFTGHASRFYSVAEHSVHVAALLEEWGHDVDVQRLGLMHDAHESVMGDIASPMKAFLGERVRLLERGLLSAFAQRFKLSTSDQDWQLVSRADLALLVHEARCLGLLDEDRPGAGWASVLKRAPRLTGAEIPTLQCWTPQTAGQRFLAACRELGVE
jgi:hypothetical protein